MLLLLGRLLLLRRCCCNVVVVAVTVGDVVVELVLLIMSSYAPPTLSSCFISVLFLRAVSTLPCFIFQPAALPYFLLATIQQLADDSMLFVAAIFSQDWGC